MCMQVLAWHERAPAERRRVVGLQKQQIVRPQVPYRNAHAVAEVHSNNQLLKEGSAKEQHQGVRHAFRCCPSGEKVICVQGMPPDEPSLPQSSACVVAEEIVLSGNAPGKVSDVYCV